MLDDSLRKRIIDTMMKVPGIRSPDSTVGRDILLRDIPNAHLLNRHRSNAEADLALIILTLENWFSFEGEWYLLTILVRATKNVEQTEPGRELLAIKHELEQRRREDRTRRGEVAALLPAELAQAHAFDLRRPILRCLSELPSKPCLSGFVISPSSRPLIGHFCDGLKYRGAKQGLWERKDVFIARTFEIDPLHTHVGDAIKKVGKLKTLTESTIVLSPIRTAEYADIQTIWSGLNQSFSTPLCNHFIVLFFTPQRLEAPSPIVPVKLDPFTSDDISLWTHDIFATLDWPQKPILLARWTETILRGCISYNNELDQDSVYMQIDYHSKFVLQHTTESEFLSGLERIEFDA